MLQALKQECRALFKHPATYVLGALQLILIGVNAVVYCVNNTLSNFEYALYSSCWGLIVLIPCAAVWMHRRLHAQPDPEFLETYKGYLEVSDEEENAEDAENADASDEKDEEYEYVADDLKARSDVVIASLKEAREAAAKEGKKQDNETVIAKAKGDLFRPSVIDCQDAAIYEAEGVETKDRILAVYFSTVLALLAPLAISLLYPVILLANGSIYFPTVLSQLAALFFLGAAFLGAALCFAATQKNQLLTLIFTALTLIASFAIMPVACTCATPYAAMLFFTLVIVLIGVFLMLVTKNSSIALLASAILEVIMVIFFVLKQDAFHALPSIVIAKLSLFERFYNFVGGMFDLRALIYFASVAAILVILGIAGFGYEAPVRSEEEADEKSIPFGGFPLRMPVIALGAALVINLCIHLFTGTALIADVSGTGLFTPDNALVQQVKKTDKPVTIYWIVQNNQEDASIRSVLSFYDAMSPRITLARCNPDVSAEVTFITNYVVNDVYNNSLLFKSGEQTRFTAYDDIYGYGYVNGNYQLAMSLNDEFDHALEYFAGSETTKIYASTGHGELEVADYYKALLQLEDMTVLTLDLSQGIPADCSVLLINAPESDLSDQEADIVYAYLENGGDMMLMTRVQETTAENGTFTATHLNNLESLMIGYGAGLIPGIIMEGESYAYNTSSPYIFSPTVVLSSITSGMSAAPVLSYAQGISTSTIEGVTTTPLLISSDDSYSKVAGSLSTTFDKEEGDYAGSMSVAVAMEKGDTHIVWVGSVSLLVEEISDISSGGNTGFLKGALTYLNGDSAVHTSLAPMLYNYGTLTFRTELAASRTTMLLCMVFPFLYLLIGLSMVIAKAYRKNQEALAEAAAIQEALDEKRRQEEEEKKARREAFKKQREEATRAALEAQRAKSQTKKKE